VQNYSLRCGAPATRPIPRLAARPKEWLPDGCEETLQEHGVRRKMGEVERYPNGTFCWIDVGTNDAPAAKEFYGGLFGWEFEDLPTSEQGTYTICRLKGKAVSGLYDQADEPVWSSYLSVADVDEATNRAKQLGASVIVEPFGTPGGGRAATIRDPAGAVVSLSRPGENFGAELVNEDGTWTWNELTSAELAAERDFYVELLGWSSEDAPGPIPRTTFTMGELLIGGGHAPAAQEDPTPRWTVSFGVADADQAAAKAQDLGGTVVLPPMDIPVGRFTIVADPQGAVFTAAAVPGGPVRGVDGA
jgi:predicted enzyme related to lactoylglutathione lyase